jgi:hypothetical protein
MDVRQEQQRDAAAPPHPTEQAGAARREQHASTPGQGEPGPPGWRRRAPPLPAPFLLLSRLLLHSRCSAPDERRSACRTGPLEAASGRTLEAFSTRLPPSSGDEILDREAQLAERPWDARASHVRLVSHPPLAAVTEVPRRFAPRFAAPRHDVTMRPVAWTPSGRPPFVAGPARPEQAGGFREGAWAPRVVIPWRRANRQGATESAARHEDQTPTSVVALTPGVEGSSHPVMDARGTIAAGPSQPQRRATSCPLTSPGGQVAVPTHDPPPHEGQEPQVDGRGCGHSRVLAGRRPKSGDRPSPAAASRRGVEGVLAVRAMDQARNHAVGGSPARRASRGGFPRLAGVAGTIRAPSPTAPLAASLGPLPVALAHRPSCPAGDQGGEAFDCGGQLRTRPPWRDGSASA